MTALLILRPQPGADATAARARSLGLSPVIAPLFEIDALGWASPEFALFDAVLITSANAIRFGGPALADYRHLPLYAVGGATAAAAKAAGFGEIVVGEGDGAEILALAAGHGRKRLLHLAGREHIDLHHPQVSIERRIVYASEVVQALPEAARAVLEGGAVVLLHSVRAASLFASLTNAAMLDRAGITIVGLSEAVRDAAGAGWAAAFAAPAPTDDALLAIAVRLCDQGSRKGS